MPQRPSPLKGILRLGLGEHLTGKGSGKERCGFDSGSWGSRDFECPPSPPYHTSCDPPRSINSRRGGILPPVDIDSLARETSVLNVWAGARHVYQGAMIFPGRERCRFRDNADSSLHTKLRLNRTP